MMTATKLHIARTGATAIAAALALSSTSLSAAPKPIIDLSKSPAESGKTAPAPAAPKHADETLPIMGGGALVLLVGGAVAIAAARRRREREPVLGYEIQDQPHADASPPRALHKRPTIVAPSASAFNWGGSDHDHDPQVEHAARRHGESWVERAYRGPTADNPSLSLKKRLKRAAFFDKREREAAKGAAQPIEADAGLPERMTESAHQRQFEAA